FVGLLVCCFVGLLVCCFVGLLVCWFVGLLLLFKGIEPLRVWGMSPFLDPPEQHYFFLKILQDYHLLWFIFPNNSNPYYK
ncbi:MAG: hypothetical protein AAB262_06070, partial [Elusimicrobiota bacterium]